MSDIGIPVATLRQMATGQLLRVVHTIWILSWKLIRQSFCSLGRLCLAHLVRLKLMDRV